MERTFEAATMAHTFGIPFPVFWGGALANCLVHAVDRYAKHRGVVTPRLHRQPGSRRLLDGSAATRRIGLTALFLGEFVE